MKLHALSITRWKHEVVLPARDHFPADPVFAPCEAAHDALRAPPATRLLGRCTCPLTAPRVAACFLPAVLLERFHSTHSSTRRPALPPAGGCAERAGRAAGCLHQGAGAPGVRGGPLPDELLPARHRQRDHSAGALPAGAPPPPPPPPPPPSRTDRTRLVPPPY